MKKPARAGFFFDRAQSIPADLPVSVDANAIARTQVARVADVEILVSAAVVAHADAKDVRRAAGLGTSTDFVAGEAACRDADIVVEATRLEKPEVLIEDAWLKPGSLLVTYGWVMAVDPKTVASVEKRVVDDWAQCSKAGALYPLIASGDLRAEHIHGEIGQIVCGQRTGRTSEAERILFWHRGFAISDIVLGSWIAERAREKGLGQMLTLWDGPDE